MAFFTSMCLNATRRISRSRPTPAAGCAKAGHAKAVPNGAGVQGSPARQNAEGPFALKPLPVLCVNAYVCACVCFSSARQTCAFANFLVSGSAFAPGLPYGALLTHRPGVRCLRCHSTGDAALDQHNTVAAPPWPSQPQPWGGRHRRRGPWRRTTGGRSSGGSGRARPGGPPCSGRWRPPPGTSSGSASACAPRGGPTPASLPWPRRASVLLCLVFVLYVGRTPSRFGFGAIKNRQKISDCF